MHARIIRRRTARLDIAYDASDAERLALMVKAARERLEPLAAMDVWRYKSLAAIGDLEGASLLIRIARVELERDGKVSAPTLTRFIGDARDMIDEITTSLLNTSVVVCLLLTIIVPMATAELTDAFAETGAMPQLLGWSAGAPASEPAMVAWLDAAAYIEPAHAARLRCGLYFTECIVLAIGMLTCSVGLGVCTQYNRAIGAMPGVLSKCELMLELTGLFRTLANCWRLCLLSTLLAVVVVTSHRSALAFFTSLGFLLCYNVYFFVIVNGVCAKCTASTPLGEGVINVTLSKLHREAKAIFAPRAQRPHERYGAAEKVTPS